MKRTIYKILLTLATLTFSYSISSAYVSVSRYGYVYFEYVSTGIYRGEGYLSVTYPRDMATTVKQEYSGNIVIPSVAKDYYGQDLNVLTIGQDAFHNAKKVKSVTIPNSITSIEARAFKYCSGLRSIEIPNSVTEIRGTAFYGCENLTKITLGDDLVESKLKYIGGGAFSGCLGLASIKIPRRVDNIAEDAFNNCPGLTSIEVHWANLTYDSRDNCNAIILTKSNRLEIGCKNTIIPESVTSIGDFAFYRCTGLTSITIPNSVTSIGDYAFKDCTGLTSVTIPNSVTEIGEKTFLNCTGLTSITLPEKLKFIGYYSFQCCTNLRTIYCKSYSPPKTDGYPFSNNVLYNATVYVPKGCKSAYMAVAPWSYFANIVEMDFDGVEDIKINKTDAVEVDRYDIYGRQLTEPTKGINIIKMSDGSTRKEYVK